MALNCVLKVGPCVGLLAAGGGSWKMQNGDLGHDLGHDLQLQFAKRYLEVYFGYVQYYTTTQTTLESH